MSPDDLHARTLADLRQRKAGNLRVAAHHRARAAEAKAHGEPGIARTLGMLAAHLEQAAALAEAEAREREARQAKWKRAEGSRAAARKPRPGRRHDLRAAILDALEPCALAGEAFKDVMKKWQGERLDSLRLTLLPDGRYFIEDENGDGAGKAYTWLTLRAMYSQSTKARR
jgi:hypothetical protein